MSRKLSSRDLASDSVASDWACCRPWKWLLTLVQPLGMRKGYPGLENWVASNESQEWARCNRWFGPRNYPFSVHIAIPDRKPRGTV
jgi:hypothetical protein